MRMKPIAILVGTLMVSASTAALAQSAAQGPEGDRGGRVTGPDYAGSQTYPNSSSGPQYQQWVPGPLSPAAKRNNPSDNQYSSNDTTNDQSGGASQSDQYSSNDSSDQGSQNHSFGQGGSNQYSSNDSWGDQSGHDRFSGQSRFNQRSSLRSQLRQAGFQNVRILDAMFLVRAKTPSGEQVVMVINPPDQGSSGMMSRSEQQGGSMSNQQFGQDQSMQGRQFGSDQRFGADRRFGSNQQFGSDQRFGSNQRFGMNQEFGTNQGPNRYGMNQSENTGSTSPRGNGQMWNMNVMSPGQVQGMLQQRGFSNISSLDREGMTYTGTADLFGEQVDLRVDARTGLVLQPFALDADQVATMLDQQGWNVRDIRDQGNSVAVLAQRNGGTFELTVDPKTGSIMNVDRHGGGMNTGSLYGGRNRQMQ